MGVAFEMKKVLFPLYHYQILLICLFQRNSIRQNARSRSDAARNNRRTRAEVMKILLIDDLCSIFTVHFDWNLAYINWTHSISKLWTDLPHTDAICDWHTVRNEGHSRRYVSHFQCFPLRCRAPSQTSVLPCCMWIRQLVVWRLVSVRRWWQQLADRLPSNVKFFRNRHKMSVDQWRV